MRVITKATLWSVVLSFLLIINFALAQRMLQEIRVTDRITAEHSEFTQDVRQLRSALLDFEIYGMRYITRSNQNSWDKFNEYRQTLDRLLKQRPDLKMQNEFGLSLYDLKTKLSKLLPPLSAHPESGDR